MAYSDTPLANQQINNSQPQIRENFQDINTLVGLNHITFDEVPTPPSIGDPGEHKYVTFPLRSPADVPVAQADKFNVYAANSAVSGLTELFLQSTVIDAPFTLRQAALNGYTYLPSGILVQWGTSNFAGGIITQNINYPIAFGVAHHVSVGNATAGGVDPDVVSYVENTNAASFSIRSYRRNSSSSAPPNAYNVKWIAIGV